MKPAIWNPGRRSWILISILAALGLTWIGFGHSIQYWLSTKLLLRSNGPGEEFFVSTLRQSADPATLLRECWATGKIVHREWVIKYLSEQAATNPSWLRSMDDVLAAGALDADMSVRELALTTLDLLHSPRLFEFAQAQLQDLDPMVRLLGLQYLRRGDPRQAVPVVVHSLEDPDLRVAAEAEVALTRWSGVDFGVRVRMAIPAQAGPDAGTLEPTNVVAIQTGLAKRREWWRGQLATYTLPENAAARNLAKAARPRCYPAPDFELRDLQGRKFNLSQFRGKTVLLNFWATWCTACVAEIPELIALQQRKSDQVIILGVVLDGVPDDHGLRGGEESAGAVGKPQPAPEAILKKVTRTVKARGINYPVLWDANGSVAATFNGGELPTTVLIDPDGLVCRRFIGERSSAVFESMISEASGLSSSGR